MSRKNYKRGTIRVTKKGVLYYYKDNQNVYIDRVIIFIAICTFVIIGISKLIFNITDCKCECNKATKEMPYINIVKGLPKEESKEITTEEISITTIEEEPEIIQEVPQTLDYRMTYYFPGDDTNSGTCTASGKCTRDFQINENGWFTYNNKIVVATANDSLKNWDIYSNSTQPTYNLYDELTLNINGQNYEAIVLDKCGACMNSPKIDLFVSDASYGLDTYIKVSK